MRAVNGGSRASPPFAARIPQQDIRPALAKPALPARDRRAAPLALDPGVPRCDRERCSVEPAFCWRLATGQDSLQIRKAADAARDDRATADIREAPLAAPEHSAYRKVLKTGRPDAAQAAYLAPRCM